MPSYPQAPCTFWSAKQEHRLADEIPRVAASLRQHQARLAFRLCRCVSSLCLIVNVRDTMHGLPLWSYQLLQYLTARTASLQSIN